MPKSTVAHSILGERVSSSVLWTVQGACRRAAKARSQGWGRRKGPVAWRGHSSPAQPASRSRIGLLGAAVRWR